jgi:shikimate dehydrogenase
MTNERIPLAGVVGWPIAHSKSPALHGYWLRRYGIAGQYVPIGLRLQDFEAGIRALPKLGFAGVNVTIPYKESALVMAASVSDRAALIGAANTLTFRSDGGFYADNTDGEGFLNNLKSKVPDWRSKNGPAVVFGAGGAARAVISALLSDGAPKVILINRTISRAEVLRDHFGARVEVLDWHKAADAFDGASTIVNTTSLGMTGNAPLTIDLAKAPQSALVTDIVYTPLKTEFLRTAEQNGHPVVDGLGMLLHQAVPGFEAWFGRKPEIDEETRKVVLEA